MSDKVSILALDAQQRLDSIAVAAGEDPVASRRRIDKLVRRTAQMVAWSFTPEFIHETAQLANTARDMANDEKLEPQVRLKAMEVFSALSSKIIDRVVPPLQRIRVSSSHFDGADAPLGSVTATAVHEAIEKVKGNPSMFQVQAVDATFVVRSGENATGDERAAS